MWWIFYLCAVYWRLTKSLPHVACWILASHEESATCVCCILTSHEESVTHYMLGWRLTKSLPRINTGVSRRVSTNSALHGMKITFVLHAWRLTKSLPHTKCGAVIAAIDLTRGFGMVPDPWAEFLPLPLQHHFRTNTERFLINNYTWQKKYCHI